MGDQDLGVTLGILLAGLIEAETRVPEAADGKLDRAVRSEPGPGDVRAARPAPGGERASPR